MAVIFEINDRGLRIINEKEETKVKDMNSIFSNMFGKIGPGMCRLSMNGEIAVKTDNGYKTYNLKTNRLVNCDSFVFDIGEEFFFIIPTNKVRRGDIIIANNKPKCVIKPDKDSITVINYENGTVETILPERHVFMGETYFYGKIVSMFGNSMKGKKGMDKMMSYMLMSEMMKGMNGTDPYGRRDNSMGMMLPFMMMNGGGFGDMFDGMFDFDSDDFDFDSDDEEEDEYTKSVREHNAALGDEKEAE